MSDTNQKDSSFWINQLKEALSTYNFDLMKESVNNGAFPDDMILHRVINHDRLDFYEYFLFSPELETHCNINYEYPFFDKDAPSFVYACLCGAIDSVRYMVENNHINQFDFSKVCQKSLLCAGQGGSIEVANFLMNHPKTKDYCNFSYNNFAIISVADQSKWNFIC